MRHPYLAQFHNPKEEVSARKVIHPPVSDNKKLTLKQYKQLIYERIRKIYGESGETPSCGEHRTPSCEYKKSGSSIHRATEVLREKHYEHRQSFNSSKAKSWNSC